MTNIDKIAIGCISAVGIFTGGALLGYRNQPPTKTETIKVEDTESKQKLVEAIQVQQELRAQLSTAEKTISDLKTRTHEKIRIVYQKDGTKVVEKEKETNVEQKTDTTVGSTQNVENHSSEVEARRNDTETQVHMDTKTTTTVVPKDKFYLGITYPVDFTGTGSTPGLEFKYRLIDLGKLSVWAGGEAFLPPNYSSMIPNVRASAGISF